MTSGPHPVWQSVKLADILHRVRKPVQVEPDTLYREIGIRSHGKGIFYKEERTGSSLGDKSVFWIEPDCFVVNIVFAWEQAVAKTTQNELGMIASHRFPMYKPLEGKVNLDYLLYFFKSPLGKYLLGLASPGGAGRNKTLGQKGFLDLAIPLPSLPEQQKITDILSTWDKAIALTEELIAAKQNRKQGLMQQLLTGNRRFGEFSGEWKLAPFSEILSIEMGRTPSRNKPEYWDQDKTTNNRWLTIADLKGKYIGDSREYISDDGIRGSRAKLLPVGTVVMSFKLTIGRAAILAHPAFTNEAICSLVPRDPGILTNGYLYHALSAVDFSKEVDQAIKGQTLNLQKLNNLTLNLPPIAEQIKIAGFLDLTDDELHLQEQKLAALKQQKQGLMQQLLTGKVRVKTG